ncbi:MAG: manganese efflux pump MntP family protein [Pseudomonadota bacterium]
MDGSELLGVAVGLGMDAFAVAVAASVVLVTITGRQVFRLAFHFGLFQALMPILGWAAARSFAAAVAGWTHWVAFALLALIGGRALWEGFWGGDEPLGAGDPSKGARMVTLSVAVSIDALAAGVSFAMLGIVVWIPAAVIGVITAAMTLAGLALGARLGAALGHRAAILGGLILVGIGVKILVQGLGA